MFFGPFTDIAETFYKFPEVLSGNFSVSKFVFLMVYFRSEKFVCLAGFAKKSTFPNQKFVFLAGLANKSILPADKC